MALAPSTRVAIRSHWAERLRCPPAAFEHPGITVTERSGRTVRVLRRGDATVVAAPEQVRDALSANRERLAERALTDVGEVVRRALAGDSAAIERVQGPSVLGYVDAASFSPTTSEARLLESPDEQRFARLRDRVPDHEWERASPTFRPNRTAGLFRDGALVALATLGEPPFPDIAVVVAPEWRGEGYGQQVVSRVSTAALELDSDAVLHYRTPRSVPASVALAASLGVERWASETVVVLQ